MRYTHAHAANTERHNTERAVADYITNVVE